MELVDLWNYASGEDSHVYFSGAIVLSQDKEKTSNVCRVLDFQ